MLFFPYDMFNFDECLILENRMHFALSSPKLVLYLDDL